MKSIKNQKNFYTTGYFCSAGVVLLSLAGMAYNSYPYIMMIAFFAGVISAIGFSICYDVFKRRVKDWQENFSDIPLNWSSAPDHVLWVNKNSAKVRSQIALESRIVTKELMENLNGKTPPAILDRAVKNRVMQITAEYFGIKVT